MSSGMEPALLRAISCDDEALSLSFGKSFSVQKVSMRVSVSSSFFCTIDSGKLSSMDKIRPSNVVSNATPRPLVRLLIDCSSASGSVSPPMDSEPTASDRPITVPMNPKIGIAHRKTLIMEYEASDRLASRSDCVARNSEVS